MCQHQPPCPPADASDREAAHVAASHPGQGWSLLCNGVVMFEDTGAMLPMAGASRRTGRPGSVDTAMQAWILARHRQRSGPRCTSGSPEATKKAR